MAETIPSDDAPSLNISTDAVCRIVIKAREFDVKDVASGAESGSNATDDGMVTVLEEGSGDPVEKELRAFIGELNEDEQIDLVALAWLGRGDGAIEDWEELRENARAAHNNRTASYLLGLPLLADYLEEGLSQFGRDCGELESDFL